MLMLLIKTSNTCAQTMLYIICTMISSVYIACKGVSQAKDWVSVDCGTYFFKVGHSLTLSLESRK